MSIHQTLLKTREDIDLAERAVAATWAADDRTAIAHLSTTCEMLILALKNLSTAVESLAEQSQPEPEPFAGKTIDGWLK